MQYLNYYVLRAFVKCRATFSFMYCMFYIIRSTQLHHTLNIYKHTTSSNMHYSFSVMRGISNIMCGGLNNMRYSFLIMRSGFVIMHSRSCR